MGAINSFDSTQNGRPLTAWTAFKNGRPLTSLTALKNDKVGSPILVLATDDLYDSSAGIMDLLQAYGESEHKPTLGLLSDDLTDEASLGVDFCLRKDPSNEKLNEKVRGLFEKKPKKAI
jgi:hypothetical protein